MEVIPLKITLLNIVEAVEAVHAANHAIDYYGGHGDTAAMKAIFAQIRMLHIAMHTFTKKHGTNL